MGHYRPNVRDLEFNLFEVFRVQDQMTATATEGGADEETARGVLRELAAQAAGPLGESFVDATATLRSSIRRRIRSPCRTR